MWAGVVGRSSLAAACRWPQLAMPGLSRRSSPAREARRVGPRAGRKRTQGWAGAGCAAYMYSFSNSLHTCMAHMRRIRVSLLECAAYHYSVSIVPQFCTASRVRIFAALSASDLQHPTAALAASLSIHTCRHTLRPWWRVTFAAPLRSAGGGLSPTPRSARGCASQ